ncbi:uncharacterized protein LOC128201111 [Galleria mellonella]|uniref:Uncharacterized protein LOC128201111 n=1 Tax=Galleria mellonella TaxID=7137 RepID=A0ABM3MN65_GALME|nr:uncharacterized protein LOC128201111 [Galleria mellonella]
MAKWVSLQTLTFFIIHYSFYQDQYEVEASTNSGLFSSIEKYAAEYNVAQPADSEKNFHHSPHINSNTKKRIVRSKKKLLKKKLEKPRIEESKENISQESGAETHRRIEKKYEYKRTRSRHKSLKTPLKNNFSVSRDIAGRKPMDIIVHIKMNE